MKVEGSDEPAIAGPSAISHRSPTRKASASWLREAEPGTPPTVPHVAVDATQAAERAVAQILHELDGRDRLAASYSARLASSWPMRTSILGRSPG